MNVMQIRHGRLIEENVAEVMYVRNLDPTSMSWSNLCDYTSPSTLIQLMAACAKPSTHHYVLCQLGP